MSKAKSDKSCNQQVSVLVVFNVTLLTNKLKAYDF